MTTPAPARATRDAASPPPRDWRAEHDTIAAELAEAGVTPAAVPVLAYVLTAQRAADAVGGDFYSGCAALTDAGVVYPPNATRLPSRLWDRLRDDDDGLPGDRNRYHARVADLAREREARLGRHAAARSIEQATMAATAQTREDLIAAWWTAHGNAVVRAEHVAPVIRGALAPDGRATASQIAHALRALLVGQPDPAGRRFAVAERDDNAAPVAFVLTWPARNPRPRPADPELAALVERIERAEDDLRDAPSLANVSREGRAASAAREAERIVFDAWTVETGLPVREAVRRWAAAGMPVPPEAT